MNDDRSLKLLELNKKAWNGEVIFPSAEKKLDSSMKRNTGFIRKLKQGITKDTKANLLKDISEVSLEKYLSELVVTANEGISRVSNKSDDIEACVEVISALHQRFSHQFTPLLMELFLQNFNVSQTESENEKEEAAKMAKLRSHVRIFTDFYLVGLFSSVESIPKENLPLFIVKRLAKKEPLLVTLLKEILNYRFKTGLSTTVATSFVVKFPQFFTDDSDQSSIPIDADVKKLLSSLFKAFTEAAISQLVELSKSLSKLMREHQKAQIRTGKSTDEYIEEHDRTLPIFERFEGSTSVLADVFNMEAPALEKSPAEGTVSSSPVIINQQKQGSEKIWENEEMRKFYEVLPDLSSVITDSEEKNPADSQKLHDFFIGLELADSKEAIDELTLRFWTDSINKKATRKRLLKFFIETLDWSKLRIYARFVASNADTLADVKDELIQYLDNGFRSQLWSNKINVKNIIFFSEMVKFRLVPTYLIFHKIRTLTMNIQIPNNIEILTILFENFGKFLINSPHYKSQMEKMVDLIQQKKKEHDLTVSNKCALDNLLVLIYPPSLTKLNSVSREISAEQKFYRILLRKELHSIPPERIVKLIRRAHWRDESIYKTMVSLFSKPEKISYQSLDLLATVLKGLFPYYRNFVVQVIDSVVEKVERGLEINDFSLNMVRISQVRYLSSLYNNNLLKIEVIIDVLFKILLFGSTGGISVPAAANEFDLPDNYFRVHLITTALLSVNDISPGKVQKLLVFLRLFEFYTLNKEQPLPREAEVKISTTFDRFTAGHEFERFTDAAESAKELSECFATPQSSTVGEKAGDAELDEDDDDDEDEIYDDEEEEAGKEIGKDAGTEFESEDENFQSDASATDESSDEESGTGSESDDDNEAEDDDDSDDELERRRMQEAHMSKLRSEEEIKAEEDLERQFQQLFQESMESRKNEKVSSNGIPMISSGYGLDRGTIPVSLPSSESQGPKSKKVAFTFLSKSGKKTQARTLGLPRNVTFVSGVLEEERKLKAEREKIKHIVLSQKFE
ncbi:LAME_0F14444g1_1 [Lachancea meyersii CBS 8951]|uniref:LAME_0F14444g1_1 n=1 Tax=Lachancea meyersii CBS 8951 TaxID=1266667 RepID=A0A1G4JY88_9SACH|nr:LAME_0F14444g1_1 [Lachancea meyersii CBS 8951]